MATRARRPSTGGLGVALAGGGFLGAAWELGALCALTEAIDGFDPCGARVLVGVSAGGFLAAGLAHGLTPQRMVRSFVETDTGAGRGEAIDPATLLRPDWRLAARQLLRTPRAVSEAVGGALLERIALGTPLHGSRLGWRVVERLADMLPTGLLRSDATQATLARTFAREPGGDDFRRLGPALRIVATDIDRGLPVAFGAPGLDHVPVSRAVAASSAVPGLFLPVEIDGRHYVDGALNKTLHASVALAEGASLVICLNPIVPYSIDASGASPDPGTRAAPVSASGLPAVLSQTVRTTIRSRMSAGLSKYATQYPGADVVLFEPRHDDAAIFRTPIFGAGSRRRVCEHAYHQTRADLRARAAVLTPVLRRHGLDLRGGVLDDDRLTLVHPDEDRAPAGRLAGARARLERTLADLERAVRVARGGSHRAAPAARAE